jgi:hypothetical protein
MSKLDTKRVRHFYAYLTENSFNASEIDLDLGRAYAMYKHLLKSQKAPRLHAVYLELTPSFPKPSTSAEYLFLVTEAI